tara:strand:- start:64 stop:1206 length:1143 start_codon:yes stop_codon:yes gene_type:complete
MASDGTCTANITNYPSNRNICVNGADMMVAQRGTSTTNLRNTGGVYTIDRFAHRRGGTWNNAYWKDELVNSGTGLFKKALKKTTTTAEGSAPGSGRYVMIGHYLEAQDTIAAFGDGTAEAKPFTVSFYVKASIATTYCLHLATSHLSTQKAHMKPFTVNNPNVWERKTCTFPALTNSIGTVTGSDNGTGYRFHWVLDAPTGSSPANTWYTHTAVPNSFTFPSGQSPTGYANTLNATFELGGVQIESGTVATDLEHRLFADELARCQRYCVAYGGDDEVHLGTAHAYNSTNINLSVHLPVPMRVKPSASTVTSGGNWLQAYMGASGNISNASISVADSGGTCKDITAFRLYLSGSHSGLSAGQALWVHTIANAKLILSAEL